MKGSAIPGRTDVILSVATLALAIIAVGVIAATSSTDEFVAWAWARHHNILSWYVRPLFILPFCYFAYRRSLLGIVITLLALVTSMFWFPAPEHASPAVNEMLRAEEAYLTANWTLWKVLIALLVPLTFAALGLWPSGDDRSSGGWRWSTRRSSSRSRGRFSSAPRPAPCRTCRQLCSVSWSATL
jgi:hypothetical protein